MIRNRFVIGVAAAALVSTAAAAQNSGTQAEQDACTPDVFRLCQAYIPDEAPIVSCLKLNRAKLSPACHGVFYPVVHVSTGTRHKRKRHHEIEG